MLKVPLFRKMLHGHSALDSHFSLFHAARGSFLGAEYASRPDVAHLSHIYLLDFAVADEAIGCLFLGNLSVPTDLEQFTVAIFVHSVIIEPCDHSRIQFYSHEGSFIFVL
jgi:hypothetical protein